MKTLKKLTLRELDIQEKDLLPKENLNSIIGGNGYVCTCWGADGYKYLVGNASSPEGCIKLCGPYWN